MVFRTPRHRRGGKPDRFKFDVARLQVKPSQLPGKHRVALRVEQLPFAGELQVAGAVPDRGQLLFDGFARIEAVGFVGVVGIARDISQQRLHVFRIIVELRIRPVGPPRNRPSHHAVTGERLVSLRLRRITVAEVKVEVVPAEYAVGAPRPVHRLDIALLDFIIERRVLRDVAHILAVAAVVQAEPDGLLKLFVGFELVRFRPEHDRGVFGQQELLALEIAAVVNRREFARPPRHIALFRPDFRPVLRLLDRSEVRVAVAGRQIGQVAVRMGVGQPGRIVRFDQLRGVFQHVGLHMSVVAAFAHRRRMNRVFGIEGVHRQTPRQNRRVVPVAAHERLGFLLVLLFHHRIVQQPLPAEVHRRHRQQHRDALAVAEIEGLLRKVENLAAPVAPPPGGVGLKIDHIAPEQLEVADRVFIQAEARPFHPEPGLVAVEHQVPSFRPDFAETERERLPVDHLAGAVGKRQLRGVHIAAVQLPQPGIRPRRTRFHILNAGLQRQPFPGEFQNLFAVGVEDLDLQLRVPDRLPGVKLSVHRDRLFAEAGIAPRIRDRRRVRPVNQPDRSVHPERPPFHRHRAVQRLRSPRRITQRIVFKGARHIGIIARVEDQQFILFPRNRETGDIDLTVGAEPLADFLAVDENHRVAVDPLEVEAQPPGVPAGGDLELPLQVLVVDFFRIRALPAGSGGREGMPERRDAVCAPRICLRRLIRGGGGLCLKARRNLQPFGGGEPGGGQRRQSGKQQFFHHGSILPLKFITSRAGNGDSIVLSSYPSPGLEKVFPGTQSHSAGGAARRVRPHTAHCGSRCALHRSPAADVPR